MTGNNSVTGNNSGVMVFDYRGFLVYVDTVNITDTRTITLSSPTMISRIIKGSLVSSIVLTLQGVTKWSCNLPGVHVLLPAIVEDQTTSVVSSGLRSSDYNGLDFIGQRVELTDYQLPKSCTLSLWLSSYRDGIIFRGNGLTITCLLYTSPSPRDRTRSRMPSSA